MRPIYVGWRKGYKGQTYMVVGSSGPTFLDLSSTGTATVPAVLKAPINVQPHDLAGWGVYRTPPSTTIAAWTSDANVTRCLRPTSCDSSYLCAFDGEAPADTPLSVHALTLDIAPREPASPEMRHQRFMPRPSLDISGFVEHNTTYAELMTLRQRLDDPELGLFEDKIRLRQELLPSLGVKSTPSIYLSRTDFEVIPHLVGRRGYVVKPSHMSESQNVFVVQDGVNLLQQAWGHPNPKVSVEEIQAAVHEFKNQTALDWECNALVAASQGVIVEELVLAEDDAGHLRVDEYKFYTVWGEVAFSENVPFSSGAALEISRDGKILSSRVDCPPFCVATCYDRMVALAEKVAGGARADFLRVDILIHGRCENLYVSEVELFPASDFSSQLKEHIAEQWRRGYGF